MRWRYLAVILLALVGFGGRRLLYPQAYVPPAGVSIPVESIASPAAQSFLVILGVGDKAVANWDGSITAAGAAILSLKGWRFAGTDTIAGTSSWKMSTHVTPAPNPPGPVQENGVIVTLSAASAPVLFDVQTAQGNFSFSSQEIPFGVNKSFLGGKALVAATAAPVQLTSTDEEEDFPSMAQSGEDVYLAYTRFVHGDRSQARVQSTTQTITDFAFLARPTGGDQVLLMHYSKSRRLWTGPFTVTGAGEDVMRTAVAVDRQGRAWIFYCAQRSGNFDLYARSARADGTLSSEIRLTYDPGTDLYPVAATDAYGRVWVAWQGFRNGNLEILATAQIGDTVLSAAQGADTFAPETIVSTSTASDWDPAIATAPNGEVAISWDTYGKGDFDVYVRRVQFTDQRRRFSDRRVRIGLEPPIPIAATLNFEARSSLAYDSQSRLWIAYEISGPKWGKDFGAFDTTGIALYANHTIQVRCLIGNDLYSTTDNVARVLPGAPAAELFLPSTPGPYAAQPDPSIAQRRAANNGVASPAAPKNNFPRLAADPEGTIYLAFREPAGSGLSSSRATGGVSVGSICVTAIVYFDGVQWHGPGVLADSDAVGDNRPSILALGAGQLLIAHSMDHRLSPLPNGTPQVDGVNSDIYALDLPVERTQQSPHLQRIGTVVPAAPDPAAAAEAAVVAQILSYRASINGQSYQLVRGDFHRHTEISWDGARDGPIIDSYRYAIDAAALGWIGCCDHDNGEGREYSWWLTQKLTDAYLLGSKFIPMFYYERSVAYPEGHRSIVFEQRGVRPLPRLPGTSPNSQPLPAPDTTMLYEYLRFFGGLSAPHTSATDQGTDWRNNDPQVEPFVEIYQGDRQNYEMPGAPRANTPSDSISGYQAAGYVSNALGKGVQLGFEASSDHVSTHMSFTNIWVTSPTRAGLMEGMRKRRTYGSTDNILADFRSGTHFMGEAFASASAPVFTVSLWGTAPFQSVVMVKDNSVVYSTSGDRVLSFSWQDPTVQKGKTSYYYVRGLQTDGQIVWVSPIWVTLQ